MQPPRRPDSSDDRYVMTKHAAIYPSEDELQAIQKIVSITERALKLVSDIITDQDTSAKGKEEDKEKKEPPKDRWEKSALMFLKAERGGGGKAKAIHDLLCIVGCWKEWCELAFSPRACFCEETRMSTWSSFVLRSRPRICSHALWNISPNSSRYCLNAV